MEQRTSNDPGFSESYWRALMEQGEGSDGPGPFQPYNPMHQGPVRPGMMRPARSRSEEQWAMLGDWFRDGKRFDAPVIGCNKGGLLVRVCDGLGFVPASQLTKLPKSLGTPDLRTDLEQMVGREVSLRLIEVDQERDRVICSERATQFQSDDVDERLVALNGRIGDDVEGTVRSVCDFGVFVDLGGVDGLIHISELSWQRVRHPSDIASVDDVLQVRILNVDLEGRRVGLSLKRLHPDPWKLVEDRYAVGDTIEATVTNVVHFGAFARIDEGVEGLIHISELSDQPFVYSSQVVSEGERVQVRILHIDSEARRLGLSIRQTIEGQTAIPPSNTNDMQRGMPNMPPPPFDVPPEEF